jgi:carbamoyl-phosphate synthase large subunit
VSGPAEVGIAAAGAALLGAAVTWRTTARRGARTAIASALVSSNPASRMAALRTVAAEGIGPFAQILRQRAGVERDPEVRRLLAEVIAQSQWEPSADEALVELRLWAHRELGFAEAAEETANRSAVASRKVAALLEPVATGAADAGIGATSVPSSAQPPAPAPAWWQLAPRCDNPVVVLVTGTGGPAGVAVLRWLRAAGHRVIAADADRGAIGLRLGDGAAVLERSDDPRFVESLTTAARVAGASVLVPTVAEELVALSGSRDELEAAGLQTWLPHADAVLDCLDKWRFAKVAQAAGVATPSTNLGSAEGVPGPFVVKPRFGRGSRDIYFADDDESLAYALKRVPEPIVQTRLEGREFTADTLVAPDGSVAGVVPRWRLETRGGISTRGETFVDPGLIVDVAELLGALGLRGPANVQGFIGEDGMPRFTEVNPRFSGGLPLSLAAGADLVGEYVHVARGGTIRPERCSYREGVVMMRYFEDVFEG